MTELQYNVDLNNLLARFQDAVRTGEKRLRDEYERELRDLYGTYMYKVQTAQLKQKPNMREQVKLQETIDNNLTELLSWYE